MSATDTASPAQSTLNSTLAQETATASVDSTPTNSESALKNAEPTKNIILTLINANVSKASEEFKEDVPFVLQDQKPPSTDQAAPTAKPTKSFSAENAFVSKDTLTIQLEFAQLAKIFPTDSSSTDSARFAPEA